MSRAGVVAALITARLEAGLRALAGWLGSWPRRRRLLVAAVLGVVVLPFAAPAAAYAATGGATNPWLSFVDITDSHGIPIGSFTLSLDDGGLSNPSAGKAASAWLANLLWQLYLFWVMGVVWLLNIAMSFKMVTLVKAPFVALSTAVHSVIGTLGIVPTFATIGVLCSAVLLFRGRSGAAFGEMAVTAVLAALVGTGLAMPTTWVASPDGLLSKAQDFGVALSAQTLTASSTSGLPKDATMDQARAAVEKRLVDELVRTPHQLINYGTILDGGKSGCVDTYNNALQGKVEGHRGLGGAITGGLRGGLTGGSTGAGIGAATGALAAPEAYTAIGEACGDEATAAAANPAQALMGTFIVLPAGGFFFLLEFTILVALLVLTMLTLWESAKFVVELVRSILPGSSRLGVFVSLGVIVTTAFFLSLTVAASGLLLLLLDAAFQATTAAKWPPAGIFIIVDVLIVAAIIAVLVLAIRAKKRGRRLGESVGKSLSSRPGSLPPSQPVHSTLRQAAAPAMQMRQTRALRHSLGAARGGPAPKPAVRTAIGKVGKVAATTAKVGLASTIGAPVYVPRAAVATKKAMAVRKAAMAAKVATRRDQAVSFGREYLHNVGAPARAARHAGRAAAPHTAAMTMAAGSFFGGAQPVQTRQTDTSRRATKVVPTRPDLTDPRSAPAPATTAPVKRPVAPRPGSPKVTVVTSPATGSSSSSAPAKPPGTAGRPAPAPSADNALRARLQHARGPSRHG